MTELRDFIDMESYGVVPVEALELAWAAGLFEGEGSIGTRKGRYDDSPRMLRLQLATTDEDVIERFRAAVGEGGTRGPYGPYAGQTKPYWNWTADGKTGARVLRILVPHLGERRRAKAEEVLRECRLS